MVAHRWEECIELLNATANTPAPLDSGVGLSSTPPQVMSPNMDNPSAKADTTTSSGSTSQVPSQVKREPQVKSESVPSKGTKLDDCVTNPEVKQEQKEPEVKEEVGSSVKQEELSPEPTQEQQEERPRITANRGASSCT